MEKELELEKRMKKNAILFYNNCKYGILAGLSKKAWEKINRKLKEN